MCHMFLITHLAKSVGGKKLIFKLSTKYIEAFGPKRVNSILDIIGVNSLWHGGPHINSIFGDKLYESNW